MGILFQSRNFVLYGMRGGRRSCVLPSRHELTFWDNLFALRRKGAVEREAKSKCFPSENLTIN